MLFSLISQSRLLPDFCWVVLQDAEVNDVRKLREQAARSFGSNRVLAATDLFTLEVHS